MHLPARTFRQDPLSASYLYLELLWSTERGAIRRERERERERERDADSRRSSKLGAKSLAKMSAILCHPSNVSLTDLLNALSTFRMHVASLAKVIFRCLGLEAGLIVDVTAAEDDDDDGVDG